MMKKADILKTKLDTVKEEKPAALNNEKLAASSVQNLLEEKNKLISDLDYLRDEEEKSKKALESLASTLHENKIDMLMNTIQQAKDSHKDTESEWKNKELELTDTVKQFKEENDALEKEIEKLTNILKETEEEASASNEERSQIKNLLKEAESEKIKEEASEMMKKADILKTKLDTVKEEKPAALNNEKLAASSVQNLLEEKNKLISDLDYLRDEEEKSKKALESLASTLHEVSSEAKKASEKLLWNE
nr:hypothetical protein [Tanacetum cinerariifolium]